MYTLFLGIFMAAFSVLFGVLAIRHNAKEKEELAKEKKRVTLLADSFAGLTEITGSSSTLNYIAESLGAFGFPKIFIFTIDKKSQTFKNEVALGANKDFVKEDFSLPLKAISTELISKTFIDQGPLSLGKDEKRSLDGLPEKLKRELQNSSILVSPIMSKKENQCWEHTQCKNTKCPSFENKKGNCWQTPETMCYTHLKRYEERRDAFKNPSTKISACLDCEVFHCSGVILVADGSKNKFTEEEENLFKTFAYETGTMLEKSYLLENINKRDSEMQRKMYEISVLKEIGERISYSLNIEKIVDIIISSLSNIIDYSTVSYMIIKPETLSFKSQLKETVSRDFVDDVKNRMMGALSALVGEDFLRGEVEEILSGTILDRSKKSSVNSFFNIPLVIDNKTVGLLTVASTKSGLYKGDDISILYRITAQASEAVSRLETVIGIEKGKLNDMIVSMIDGVVMIDDENRIVAINPVAKEMIGVGEDITDIFDLIQAFEGKLDIRDKIEEVKRKKKTITIDEYSTEKRILKIFISPVKSKGSLQELKNAFLGTVLIMHDVTREKEVERMKSEFVSVASHQLRTPLSAIKWFMEMLINEDAGPMNTEQISYLTQAYETNENMIDLVNSLLNISRIESGRMAVEPEEIDIVKFCDGIYGEIKMVAADKKQTIEFKKPSVKIKKIMTDPRLFRQVIQNLLSNAIKYTPKKGKIVFTISKMKDGFVQFDIKDNGLGIPIHQQDKLFQKFFRADNVMQTEVEGTGLGLYVCKSAIEMLGGKIWFVSEENKGATFSCTLPLTGSRPKKGERSLIASDLGKEFAKK